MAGTNSDARSIEDEIYGLDSALSVLGEQLAVFLVYERPSQVLERPALARTAFAERCVSDQQLDDMVRACREIGAYIEVFEGEVPFVQALASGRLNNLGRRLKIVYNGIGFGITEGGFLPGRMALLPSLADAFGLVCAHSDAFTCAFSMHRYYSSLVLRALGVAGPDVWHYRPRSGWLGGRPDDGTKVIAKSTYEAWSLGVSESSVFVVDESCDDRVQEIANRIGQPVTIERFISGREVCVPVLAGPTAVMMPPVEQVLNRAPNDPDAVMTFEDNMNGQAVRYVPFKSSDELLRGIEASSLRAFEVIQARALGRIDFRIDGDGRHWLTDSAVVPGLSRSSSAFASFASVGVSHGVFIRAVFAANLASRGLL